MAERKPDIDIRIARQSDISAIATIEKESFSDPWSEHLFSEAISDATHFNLVMMLKEDLIGYIISTKLLPDCEIENIAIKSDLRGKGYGKILLNDFLDHVREAGATRVLLEVREGNKPARSLYESAGFKKDGVRPKYYIEPVEDAVLMSVDLTENKEGE